MHCHSDVVRAALIINKLTQVLYRLRHQLDNLSTFKSIHTHHVSLSSRKPSICTTVWQKGAHYSHELRPTHELNDSRMQLHMSCLSQRWSNVSTPAACRGIIVDNKLSHTVVNNTTAGLMMISHHCRRRQTVKAHHTFIRKIRKLYYRWPTR